MLRIGELLASAVFKKIQINHLRNASTTVRPFGPHFRGQEANKCLNDLHNSKWSAWTIIYKTVNLFEISWAVIEKSMHEHDLKPTRLCDLLPTGSKLWRLFWSKWKDYRGLRWQKCWSCYSFSSFPDMKKIISWRRRRRRRWPRRTSTIALNENAFVFRLKTLVS